MVETVERRLHEGVTESIERLDGDYESNVAYLRI